MKRKMKRTSWWQRYAGVLLSLLTVLALYPSISAHASPGLDDWEWGDEWGEAYATCDECGITYMATDCYSSDDALDELSQYFCPECGRCNDYGNNDCYSENHCYDCGECLHGDYFEPLHDDIGVVLCYTCAYSNKDDLSAYFCEGCGGAFGIDVSDLCSCPVTDYGFWHCVDCHIRNCERCELPIEVNGFDCNDIGCDEHNLCETCIFHDDEHCKECGHCDEEVCPECGLCESCNSYEEHCPECNSCWGDNGVIWCNEGGDHCALCCEENDWMCEQCHKCTESAGLELCDDCGLCERCCADNSEDKGCEHGYCIESSDYEDHLCPNCQECPEDNECEFCGLCEDCQQDYHCEHELCPDGDEWDDHLCVDCGDCFEEDELCEWCHKCESCNDHCEHDFCPEDAAFEDDLDHFICEQCSDCFEGSERCDDCGLCEGCCAANTAAADCDHDLCVQSEAFAEHWCYEDEQCLEKCNHQTDCAHNRVSDTWETNGTAHWHVCRDCGAAVDKAVHSEGSPVTIVEPNAETRKNGTASISCAVCDTYMSTISLPYVPIPEDGSPYIITQPKDYEGKTSEAYGSGTTRYATFKVNAGGKNLKYQWYLKYRDQLLTESDNRYEGTQTPTLRVIVYTDDCDGNGHQYYCVVTNSNGSVTSNVATVNAQHVFGRYEDNGDGTHGYYCLGECGYKKYDKAHRFGEWTLVRAATSTQTGLREQKCMDCNAKNSEEIPKVEAGHVHTYDQVHYNTTEHWFTCVCGVASPDPHEAHLWDKTTVVTEPTEKRTGKKEISCSTCGITKTETIDKLPHTHQWWTKETIPSDKLWTRVAYTTQSGTTAYKSVPNTDYWDRSSAQHYFKCKTCDEINSMRHTWSFWSVSRKPSSTEDGRMFHRCVICNMEEYKNFPYGTYPVMIVGGIADKDYAKSGETVTIIYDPIGAQYGFEDNTYSYPVRLKEWCNMKQYYGDNTIDYGGSWVTAPNITFANSKVNITTFTMPSGPAVVIASAVECEHNVGTYLEAHVDPTCTNYGHESNSLCVGCYNVLKPGARIEPLGHDLPDTPIAGTAVVAYCSKPGRMGQYVANNVTNGYEGDFLCNRCGKTVKGKNTPLTHGLVGKDTWWNSNFNNVYEIRDSEAPTCTKDGKSGDTYCKLCNKLATRSTKVERLGHNWSEWTVDRAATTKIKGREIRTCLRFNISCHAQESRVTDYSGPDYTLKADKTRLNFEWVYGTTPQAQTVTFTSTGRNKVTAITDYRKNSVQGSANVAMSGLKVTITPNAANVIANGGEAKSLVLDKVTTENGSVSAADITAPEITLSFSIKKATPTFKFADAGKNAIIGDKTASPKISGAADGMTFTYYSSDNSIAVVDATTGEVKGLKAGTVTITAKFAGNDYYTSFATSYTLTVTTPDAIDDLDADGAARTSAAKQGTYDLSGRKVEKVQRTDVYVRDGKKVSIK